MKCPDCRSKSITKYGHSRGKQRYICKKCQRTFTEFSSNNYPPTSVHPLFIAYILHNYKDEPLDLITKKTNDLLQFFKSHNVSVGSKKKVSKPTVYKWMNKYEAFADINKIQVRYYFGDLLRQIFPPKPIEGPPEQEFVWAEIDLTIGSFKDYKEFLEFYQNHMNKKSFEEFIKLGQKILKKFFEQNKKRTIKQKYLKHKQTKTTDGSKKKYMLTKKYWSE